jgi:hypothetical protein
MPKLQGATLWKGRSRLNGAPIKVVVTGLSRPSENPKTGPQLQVWILPRGLPVTAVRTGTDASVCGECPHRPTKGGSCYVSTHRAPQTIARAYGRGRYPVVRPREARRLLAGRSVRLGAWGDPAAVPARVWRSLLGTAKSHTGYSHSWKGRPDLRGLVMASVDSPEERDRARAAGFRTFRVSLDGAPGPGEIVCPASAEAGFRTDCNRCGLCDGSRGPNDRRASIVIKAHGSASKVGALARWAISV